MINNGDNPGCVYRSSSCLYNDQLVAHDSVSGHVLSGLTGVKSNDDTVCPFVFIDTAGLLCATRATRAIMIILYVYMLV